MGLFFQSRRTPPPPAPDESTLNVPLRVEAFVAFGKPSQVSFLAPNGDEQANRFMAELAVAISNLEGRLDRRNPQSQVSEINRNAGVGWVSVDPEMEGFLTLCDSVPFMTQGILDPSILPLVDLWERISTEGGFPAAEEVSQARALVGWGKLQRRFGQVFLPEKGMGLDLGCVAYGMAADTIAQLAGGHAIPGALVEVGPACRSVGQPPGKSAWSIKLEDPKEVGKTSLLELFNRAAFISGRDDQALVVGDRAFPAIIDPKTGWPVANGTLRTAVLAPNAIQAGIVATTAFILGLPAGIDFIQSFPNCEGTIITAATRGQTRGYLELSSPR